VEVQFRRTDKRRYAVVVLRREQSPLEFQGPGYDPLLPHDLVHLIVESELSLERGVFGFMAAGGHTGGNPHLDPGENRRQAARRRAKAARRDREMLRKGGRAEGPLSERAAFICAYIWLRRSKEPERRKRAAEIPGAKETLGNLTEAERQAFTKEFFDRVCARMDELSAKWARLEVGQSLLVQWPELR
jgi:hypothetical protein